jgi:glycosyltransferase involved in cell wall biosynthesis
MMLKKLLTIVIPCKNEGWGIQKTLYYLNLQNNIDGISVIIADSSDDWGSLEILKNGFHDLNRLNIKIVEGGYPSKARKIGATYVITPYVLFLDADIHIIDQNMLCDLIESIQINISHLVTAKYITDFPYNILYRIFDLFQSISIRIGTPFAIGGFQLWNKQIYDYYGGFNEDDLFAEDFTLSKKVKVYRFHVFNGYVYTSPRRFKDKGILYIIRMMFLSYINRDNPKFFKKHHNYWNNG